MKKYFIFVLLLLAIFSIKNGIAYADGYDLEKEKINETNTIQKYILNLSETYVVKNGDEAGILNKSIIYEYYPIDKNNFSNIEEDIINNNQNGVDTSIEDSYEEYKIYPLKIYELFNNTQPPKKRPRPIMPIIKEIEYLNYY